MKFITKFCDSFPVVVDFLPSSNVIQKLILKTGQIKNEIDIRTMINPKERRRFFNENDSLEPLYQPYFEIKIKKLSVQYPCLTNYPGFYEETNLMHLAEQYKPQGYKK